MTSPASVNDPRRGAPTSAAATPRLASLPGVLALVALYGALYTGLRLLASSNLGEDDVTDAIYTQALRLAWDPLQPPIYGWLLWLAHQLAPPAMASFMVLKYTVLVVAAGFLFATARRVTADAGWALLTIESYALIYQFSWRFPEGYTHKVGAICAVAAGLWALLRVFERPAAGRFAALGLVSGLGLLTSWTTWTAYAALMLAALADPILRRALLRPAFIIAAALIGMIVMPFLGWIATEPERLARLLSGASAETTPTSVGAGLWEAVRAPFFGLFPMPLILAAIMPGLLVTRPNLSATDADVAVAPNRLRAFLLRYCLIVWALDIGLAVLWRLPGMPSYGHMPATEPSHTNLANFMPAVVWLIAHAKASLPDATRIRAFTLAAAAVALLALSARLLNLFVWDPICSSCRWAIPYEALAGELKSRGLTSGTILAADAEIGGNLRRFFPGLPVRNLHAPWFAPPGPTDWPSGPIALVWNPQTISLEWLRVVAGRAIPPRVGARLEEAVTVSGAWRHPWRRGYHRQTEWTVLVVPAVQGR